MPTPWIILIALPLLFAGIFGFKIHLSVKRNQYHKNMETAVLRVAVSKVNERGPMVMEHILAALHGIEKNYSTWDSLSGKPEPRISLEMGNVGNKIQFFIWTPQEFKTIIESQIYAQYPDVEIEVVDDYALQTFSPNENKVKKVETPSAPPPNPENLPELYQKHRLSQTHSVVTAELRLRNPDFYPIKRYGQFEEKITQSISEPLAGITATLSKLNATDEQAWIQFVISPDQSRWHKRAKKCLQILSQGQFQDAESMQNFLIRAQMSEGIWRHLLYTPFLFLFWMMRGFRTQKVIKDTSGKEVSEDVTRSHDKEDSISASVDKINRLTYEVNIRLVYIPRRENVDLATLKLNEIAGSLRQFDLRNSNGFEVSCLNQSNAQILKRYQQRLITRPNHLSIEELATLYHMPSAEVGTPNVLWVNSRKLEPPHNLPLIGTVSDDELSVIGQTNFRSQREKFGIKTVDRRRHIYIIGKTGMGKSVLLENMISSDVKRGKGVAVIDPHGDLAEAVIDAVPSHRTNDVVILDPSDTSHPFAFNMLEYTEDPNKRNLMASGLLGVFKKMYSDSWGPRLEHILRNCLLALVEYPNTSMLGIMRILVDDKYRRQVVNKISNPMVKSFWEDEFGKMQDRQRTEAISPIQNKVGQFLSSPMIRNIVGQVKSTVNIRFMMDTGKIIVVNLSKGKIGEDNSSLLGSMLITKFQLDAMSRADVANDKRKDFYLYVDEFQNFATDAFAVILSEARKYKLNLIMANQYVAQMPDEVRDAVFGNVGTSLCFQVGFDDAECFSNQFSEEVLPNDITSLPKYQCYTKLMIDGMPSKTFSLSTLPPPVSTQDSERRDKIVRLSRERYCKPREVVEDKILRWSQSAPLKKGKK